MVTASKDVCDNVARMPSQSSSEMLLDDRYQEDTLLPLQLLSSSSHHKRSHHIPARANSRARRQKFSLTGSPHLRPPTLRRLTSSGDECLPAPPILCQNNSRELLPPCLSRKPSTRKLLHRRNQAREHLYRSEADFLDQNQHHFTTEDLQAVLAALAEESRIDEKLRQQEEESMLLAQELAIQDSEDNFSRKVSEEESILLATELALEHRKACPRSHSLTSCSRADEEESILLARDLAIQDSETASWEKPHVKTAGSSAILDRQSILLAQELAIAGVERSSTRSNRSSASGASQGDLEALVVALRAELDESADQCRGEQESYRLACQLVSEGAAVMDQDGQCTARSSMDDWGEDQSSSDSRFQAVQCQVCHFDIEDKETLRDLPCGHCFHAHCINRWFLTDRTDCPCCRRRSIA